MHTLTKTFENSDIRIADINGEILWNLKDVCASLGMGSGSEKQMRKRHGANYFQLVSFRHFSHQWLFHSSAPRNWSFFYDWTPPIFLLALPLGGTHHLQTI